MLHLISSKFARDVLGTDGQDPFGCARNRLTADTNTSKHNITWLPFGGEIGITQSPTREGELLLHSPHPCMEGIAHKVRRVRVPKMTTESIHSPYLAVEVGTAVP